MRIFILVLVTILFSSNINSQTIGKVVYKSILKKNSNKPIIEELLFSKDKSLYRLIKKEKPPVSSFDESENKIVFNLESPDSIHPFIMTDLREKQIYSKVFLTYDSNESFEKCIIKEPLSVQWNFLSDTMTIHNYKCKKATTRFRGRNYIAWYTEDVPLFFGPWKFHGLPGLLVRINDDESKVAFYLEKIEIPYKGNFNINRSVFANPMSIDKYAILRDSARLESQEAFMEKLLSKLPRGAEIESINEGDTNDIEREF